MIESRRSFIKKIALGLALGPVGLVKALQAGGGLLRDTARKWRSDKAVGRGLKNEIFNGGVGQWDGVTKKKFREEEMRKLGETFERLNDEYVVKELEKSA